jgi:hypothetical protein
MEKWVHEKACVRWCVRRYGVVDAVRLQEATASAAIVKIDLDGELIVEWRGEAYHPRVNGRKFLIGYADINRNNFTI